jgi:hypothetical protein
MLEMWVELQKTSRPYRNHLQGVCQMRVRRLKSETTTADMLEAQA